MKNFGIYLLLCICLLRSITTYSQNHWQQIPIQNLSVSGNSPANHTLKYLAFKTDDSALRSELSFLSNIPADGKIIEFPLSDGVVRKFKVWQSPVMPDELAARFPQLRTFTAVAIDNPGITAKLDFTLSGFHAMISDGQNTSFIDPLDNSGSGKYMVHCKKDETREMDNRMNCNVKYPVRSLQGRTKNPAKKTSSGISNGYQLRSYRLALACDHFYADSVTHSISPTVAQVLSAMVTSLNRINGVYERELSITMVLVTNEDKLIFTTEAGDPYSSDNANPDQLLFDNQRMCDSLIGNANYDLGHVFTTGAGGLSQVGIACQSGYKAESVTGRNNPIGDGFDIDYVAHEIGHEFGANHPFNDDHNESCNPFTIYDSSAYEPGSGSTIMAYAGICGPDDLQPHSDAYFHAQSLLEINSYITTFGDGCAVKTQTANKQTDINSFSRSYTIPFLTPFELTAPSAVDSVADTSLTYCWEQWNLGDFGMTLSETHQYGPIFRSYSPSKSPTRIFPNNTMVLAGVLSNAGNENAEGEKAPDVARHLTFKLTIRDIYMGTGFFSIPNDSIFLDVVDNGSGTGFAVTCLRDSGSIFIGNSTQNITWNVAETNTFPVNATNVDIYLSRDGGSTWQDTIGNFPNNGSAIIRLPNPDTVITNTRIKIKGSNNVFFNVNRYNFAITHSDGTDTTITLYPVPAHNNIWISSGSKGLLQIDIYNSIGQQIWKGSVNGLTEIPVGLWARGVYIMKAVDVKKQRTVKKFVLD